jgi:SAM-dependent methyltransferase
MPSSHNYQLNEIVDLIRMTDPQRMLDIGTGFGKYGFLAREYLELWNGREKYGEWERQIDGIEAFEPYLTPVHHFIYSRVFKGDALKVLETMTGKYDLVLLVDVLEHFTREDGMKVLDHCMRISRNTLVSVPIAMTVQDAVFGNSYETHRYQWNKKDFSVFTAKFFVPNNRSLICYIGEDSQRIFRMYRKERSRQILVLLLEYLKLRAPLKKLLGRS